MTVISHGAETRTGLQMVQTSDGQLAPFDDLEVHAAHNTAPLLLNLSMCRTRGRPSAEQQRRHTELRDEWRGWHLKIHSTIPGSCAWGEDEDGQLSLGFKCWYKVSSKTKGGACTWRIPWLSRHASIVF
jgi:hypothetical protein